jgi:predicted RNase H-like HicB family nuclease
MLTGYLQGAVRRARYEVIEDDGTFYGAIPGLDGVWGNAPAMEACRQELESVLQEWLLFRLSRQLPIPPLDGIELTVREVA